MRVAVLILVLGLAQLPVETAVAEPGPQLVRSVQSRLTHYGFHADVSQMSTATVAELHLTLSSPEGYFTTRRKLAAILRSAREGD